MTTLRFGAKGKAYQATAGTFGSPTYTEVQNVNGDLSLEMTYEEFDASIRIGSDETFTEPTVRTTSVSFKMLEDLADARFLALRAAFLAKTALHMLFCSGVYTDAGETYTRGWMKVNGMKKTEPYKGVNTWEFTFKFCLPATLTEIPVSGITPIS